MKLSGINTKKSVSSKYTVAVILMMHLGFAYTASSQNEINVMNDPHPNIGNLMNNNININVMPRNPNLQNYPSTGPNGSGNINPPVIIQAPVIQNPLPARLAIATPPPVQTAKPAINPPKKTTPVVRAPKPQPKPTSRVAAYKPKPAAPKNITTKKITPVRKPASPVLAVARPKPVTPKKIVPKQKPAPVQPAVAILPKPLVVEAPVVQQNEDHSTISAPQVITASQTSLIPNAPLLVKTAALPEIKTSEKSIAGRSESSTGSQRAYASHKSKHKSMKHLRYAANKKINQLFAKNRKHKIDPARCFVWK